MATKTVVYTTSNTSTGYTMPADMDPTQPFQLLALGAGGAGYLSANPAGGGGSAACASTSLSAVTATITPGSTKLYVSIGAGGSTSGAAGGVTWANIGTNANPGAGSTGTSGVLAAGGGAANTTGTGGAGGTTANSGGQTFIAGSAGGNGQATSNSKGGGAGAPIITFGGIGRAGGIGGAGATSGGGIYGGGGGGGGAEGTVTASGAAGYGAGGAGVQSSANARVTGGNGFVILTYTVATTPTNTTNFFFMFR